MDHGCCPIFFFNSSFTSGFPVDVIKLFELNFKQDFQNIFQLKWLLFSLLAAVSTCVINSTSDSVVMTQTSGVSTHSSSSCGPGGGGEDESRSEGGVNSSQQQLTVPSSPSTKKSFFKKNFGDGMDRYVILLGKPDYRKQKNHCIICL